MAEITIGRLRGGFCVSWRDQETGKRRRYQLAARSRKEAEAEARDVYLKHSTARAGGSTVAAIWEAYRDYLGKKKTAETMGYTGKAILPHFGHLRPDQITTADCRAYIATRESAGRAPGTIHTELGHLRSCLTWAQKSRLIDVAPHIERPPKPDSKVEAFSPGQISALIDAANAPHVRLAIVLLATTAGRVGAILDLTWDRVDFDRGVINLRVESSVTRKGRAAVPMNNMARAALSAAHEMRLSEHVIEYGGEPVKSIRTGYNAACERAGLPTGVHKLRHSAAVIMLSNGVPMEMVSQMLGHSNIATTRKVYARFAPDHMAPAADVLVFGRFSEPQRTSQKR